jgi:hypothetical protein
VPRRLSGAYHRLIRAQIPCVDCVMNLRFFVTLSSSEARETHPKEQNCNNGVPRAGLQRTLRISPNPHPRPLFAGLDCARRCLCGRVSLLEPSAGPQVTVCAMCLLRGNSCTTVPTCDFVSQHHPDCIFSVVLNRSVGASDPKQCFAHHLTKLSCKIYRLMHVTRAQPWAACARLWTLMSALTPKTPQIASR